MTGATHALVGAVIGRIIKKPFAAFVAGVVSHAVCDMVPHRDYSPAVEAPLLAVALVAIGKRFRMSSPEFWGAIGAVLPDVEHVLSETGIIRPGRKIFPTHLRDGIYHGRESDERISQALLAAASLAALSVPRK